MKKIYLGIAAVSVVLLAGGCAKKVESVNGSIDTINNALLEQKYDFVPNDPYLKGQNYAYEMFLSPAGKYLIQNSLVTKTFLLAHNSQNIVIIGESSLIEKYKNYFIENGVKANIYLQPIDDETSENSELYLGFKNQVKILFFNKK